MFEGWGSGRVEGKIDKVSDSEQYIKKFLPINR